jgi:hypothetical protein
MGLLVFGDYEVSGRAEGLANVMIEGPAKGMANVRIEPSSVHGAGIRLPEGCTLDHPTVWSAKDELPWLDELDREAPLMDRSMMVTTEQHEVLEDRRAAVGPMDDVMRVDLPPRST